jgi:hypothetical protein
MESLVEKAVEVEPKKLPDDEWQSIGLDNCNVESVGRVCEEFAGFSLLFRSVEKPGEDRRRGTGWRAAIVAAVRCESTPAETAE